jgi:hypothetical protein
MTFDDVCSCLVAPYRWSFVGQDWWLPGTGFLELLEANEERSLKDEAAPAAKRWRVDNGETSSRLQTGSAT